MGSDLKTYLKHDFTEARRGACLAKVFRLNMLEAYVSLRLNML